MAEFADVFKRLRLESGLTQQELADRLGITKSAVSMYERGERRPNFEIAEAITDFFHVDLNYLIGTTDKIQKPAGDQTDPAAADKYLAVSLEEIELINAYRHADDQARHLVAYVLKIGGKR